MGKRNYIVWGVVGVVLLCVAGVAVWGFNGRFGMEGAMVGKFRLEEELYGEGEFLEISGEEYEERAWNGESFLVVARMEVCPAEFPVTDTVRSLAAERGVKFYSLKDEEFRKTSLKEKVKFLPSVVIVKEGEVVDFLDAEDDEDLERYKSTEELLKWLEEVVEI